MKKVIVFIYSLVHFIVDLACAVLVKKLVTPNTENELLLFIAVILYNFFAFSLQFPIGFIADKINKNGILALVGCLLVVIAYIFPQFALIACIIAGIGNAMYHIGSGIDVLNISDKKASLSGIYVSTGALGIFLGSSPNVTVFNSYIMIFLLIISAVIIKILYDKIKDKVINEKMIIPLVNKTEKLIITCLMITVIIRSYMGFILAFEWKNDFSLALIATLAVVLGKMLGGIIGDKIGFIKISILSLLISSISFIFAFDNWIIGCIAILFFNMTMPITLTALANLLPNNKGMAFGLLTFALFLGSLPVFFGYGGYLFNQFGLFLVTIVSMIILYIGIDNYNKEMKRRYG